MRSVLLPGLLLSLMVFAGCGDSVGPVYEKGTGTSGVNVKGSITHKSSPLPGGVVTFISATDGTKKSSGQLTREGTYEVTSAPEGDCVVTVDTEMVRGQDMSNLPGSKILKDKVSGPAPPSEALNKMPKYVPIDRKYADPKKTDLKANLTKGENSKSFELK